MHRLHDPIALQVGQYDDREPVLGARSPDTNILFHLTER